MTVTNALSKSFKANPCISNPHLQTLVSRLGSLFSNTDTSGFHSEDFQLDDGDFLELVWTEAPQNRENKPLVLVFHGLEGSIESPYASSLLNTIKAQGWLGLLMHFRGCGQKINKLDRSYHSGDTDDIRYIIKKIKQQYHNVPLFAVGYSLGGNALLKYLAEAGNASALTAAVAVSVPFQLNLGADRLDQGFSKFYQWYLLRSLRQKMQRKFKQRQAPFDISNKTIYKNFWSFDDAVTAPLHGFETAENYYKTCSSRQYLGRIQTQTLIIHAMDDPFLPPQAIPESEELSDTIHFELTSAGGHVGFIEGGHLLDCNFWLNRRIPEYIKNYI